MKVLTQLVSCLLILRQHCVSGQNDSLQLDCTGCVLPPYKPDYFCPETTQLFYFRCQVTNSVALVWNLLSYEVTLSTNTRVDNVIRKGSDVTILAESITTDNGETANFSSHLWIDFNKLPKEVYSFNVICKNASLTSYKQLIALGAPSSPANINATAAILNPGKEAKECFVYYEWDHPNPDQVLYYETTIFRVTTDSVTFIIHQMIIPQQIQNATCILNYETLNSDAGIEYRIMIVAVDRCDRRKSNDAIIDTKQCSNSQRLTFYEGLIPFAILLFIVETM